MIYVLRKLIAFVFLGGMFWFIYQDLGNIGKPWFMHALGMIAVAFGFFWLVVPMVVVWLRRRSRCMRNRERYAEWLAAGGVANIRPRPAKAVLRGGKGAGMSSVEPDERVFFHEKGTLYVDSDAQGVVSAIGGEHPVGRPSDVAFPGYGRKCHVLQRTHCYFTDRQMAFAGKEVDFGIPFADIAAITVTPGGIVFGFSGGGSAARCAFTFHNPLVAAAVLRSLAPDLNAEPVAKPSLMAV